MQCNCVRDVEKVPSNQQAPDT